MAGVHVVSLQVLDDQEVAPWTWHTVRFSYDSLESYDSWNMHNPAHPSFTDGPVTDWFNDPRSGLIFPSKRGWGVLEAEYAWRDGDYTELRHQFVRDPFRAPDATGLRHHPRSVGVQYFGAHWGIFVKPETPIAFQVYHNSSEPLDLADAQLKLTIHDVEEPAG
jgi:hypothetical protein